MSLKIIVGPQQDDYSTYVYIEPAACIGRIVKAVGETWVAGNWEPELCIVLLFHDGTKCGFVLPTDER